MSPRAACRLETLGFPEVYDYVAGKMDWFAAGLPREGAEAGTDRVGDHARSDVPPAAPNEDSAAVSGRRGEWDVAVVVKDGVVLGVVTADALSDATGRAVEAVMAEGPKTYRPHMTTKDVAKWLRESDEPFAVVTEPGGHLLGVALRSELESAAASAEAASQPGSA